jgi:hypothetical protein
MADRHSVRDLAHRAMHRIPGLPAHGELPAGHQGRTRQGTTHQGRAWRHPVAHNRSHDDRWNHSPTRPPRVLAAWQRRIAALFGQDLR